MDFRMDENEQMLHDLCTRFAREQLAEAGAEADRAGATPPDLLSKGLDLGMFLDAIPAAQGGYLEESYSHTQRVIRLLALGRGCPAVALRYEANTEFALAAPAFGDAGTQILAELAESPGETLACVAYSDGKKPVSAAGGALNGAIGAVPNAVGAAYTLVVGFPDEDVPFAAIVAADQLQVEPAQPMALKATAVGNVRLTDTKPLAILTGDEALPIVRLARSAGRLAAGAVGVGSAAQGIEYADAYAAERVQFSQPIGRFESMARLMHENRAALDAAKYVLLAGAQALDHQEPGADELCRRASQVAGEASVQAAIDAVQIYGGYGFVNDYPAEKIMRDTRACTTLAGDGLREQVLAQARG